MTLIRLAIGDPVAIELTPEGEPPTELRLFRAGKNPSTKGDFIFDDKAARDVIDTYRAMGRNWVMADYDHGSLLSNPVDPSKSSKSAGRAKLEVRNGELWAIDIKWTPDAAAGIKAGEWPSISPAFKRDDEGRPYWLVNFALTGNPSLFGPAELIAANALLESEESQARAGAEKAQETLIEELSAMNMERLKAMIKEKGITKEQMMKALGCSEDEYSALMAGDGEGDMERKLAQMLEKKMETKEGIKANVIAASIHIATDASEEVIIDRLSVLVRAETELLSVTGAKTISEAHGVVAGWKDSAAKLVDATAKLNALEAQGRKDRVTKAIEQAKADKKLTPAEAEQLSVKGEADPEWLEGYLKVKAPVAALNTTHKQPQTEPDTKGKTGAVDLKGRAFEQLSNNEKAELYSVDKDQYEALRDDWAARGKPLPTKAA